MAKRPLLTNEQLVGDPNDFEFERQVYGVVNPNDLTLKHYARISQQIGRFNSLLAGPAGDTGKADALADLIIADISPDLVADHVAYRQLDLEDKSGLIEGFVLSGQDDDDEDDEEAEGQQEAEGAKEPPEPTDWGDVIPRLQKFYGGSPLDWFELTIRWLKCFNRMLPVLNAETILYLGEGTFVGGWPTSQQHLEAIEKAVARLNRTIRPDQEVGVTYVELKEVLVGWGFKPLPRPSVEAEPQA